MPPRPGLTGISQVREPRPGPTRTDTHRTNTIGNRFNQYRTAEMYWH